MLLFIVGALTCRPPGRSMYCQLYWYWWNQCSSFCKASIEFSRLFVFLLVLMQNWSSLPQETSSTPWHHPVLTSCWEGKVGTLLLAHSQSAQRRAPLSLESRPRGGDWSGLYFDLRFLSTLSTVMDFSRSPDIIAGRALTNSKCGLSVQNKNLHMPFSHAPTKPVLPKHQDQVSL